MAACCDTPLVLKAPEHDLDTIVAFIFPPVVFDWFLERFTSWNAVPDSFCLQGIPEAAGIIISIRQQPLCHGKAVQQSRGTGTGVITDLVQLS